MERIKIEKYNSFYIFHWDDSYEFKGESHIPYEIVFVEKGKAIVTEEESVYTLAENQMIIHAPNKFHCIKSAPKSAPTVRVMSFYATGDIPTELTGGVITLSAEDREEYLYVFETARKVFEQTTQNVLDVEEADCRLIAFLIRISRGKSAVVAKVSQSALTYQKIASFMAKEVCSNHTIDEIAEQNFVSKSYMKYLFYKYAGISPKKYDIHLKIQAANKMMEQGLTIVETASRLNFSSPNYFSSFYKKQTGISPFKFKLSSD